MSKHKLHISDIVIDGESWPALIFYDYDKGIDITEIKVNQEIINVDDITKARLNKECLADYKKNEPTHNAIDKRKNPKP